MSPSESEAHFYPFQLKTLPVSSAAYSYPLPPINDDTVGLLSFPGPIIAIQSPTKGPRRENGRTHAKRNISQAGHEIDTLAAKRSKV